jgi:hypothetical protein
MSSRLRFAYTTGLLLGLAALAAWLGVVAAKWRVEQLDGRNRSIVTGDAAPARSNRVRAMKPPEKPTLDKIAPPQIDPATLRVTVPPPPVELPAKGGL